MVRQHLGIECHTPTPSKRTATWVISTTASGRISPVTPAAVYAGLGSTKNSAGGPLPDLQVLHPCHPPGRHFAVQIVVNATIGEDRLVIDLTYVLDAGQTVKPIGELVNQTPW